MIADTPSAWGTEEAPAPDAGDKGQPSRFETAANRLRQCLERHTAARFPTGGGRFVRRRWWSRSRNWVGRNFTGYRLGDEFLHFLAWTKCNDTSFWHRNLLASSGVSADARGAGLHFKYAEIAQFPTLPFGQRAGNGVKSTFDDLGNVTLGHTQHVCHPDHQFAFCHCHRARPSFH